MMTFLLYTIIAWLANASLVKILHISIQPGQWIDTLFNYQNRLRDWDLKGKAFLSKVGGNCETCFSHVITFVSFWAYFLFMKIVFDTWITDGLNNWVWVVIVNIVWYLVYISIGSILSLYFIVKLFAK